MSIRKTKLKRIAIHLPQFHPVKENDEWWEKGFTEWNNVVRAKPRFKKHYQPQFPADLGFYDLRLEEARLAQEALAKEYNIYGFCYYHYWFNGKRLLEEPVERKLKNPNEDLPFMLCWANENWTRTWDGRNKNILMKQDYSHEDDLAHIRSLIKVFKDPRYIRYNGKPVFAFYRPDLFPDMDKTIEIFRAEAKKNDLELHLLWFERHIGWTRQEGMKYQFDAAIEFQPLSKNFATFKKTKSNKYIRRVRRVSDAIRYFYQNNFLHKNYIHPSKNNVLDYTNFVEHDLAKGISESTYPGVSPGWDNSSRRRAKPATIFHDNTPESFEKWISGKEMQFIKKENMDEFLFINAWNEWAEGNHLEPCKKWGTKFLEKIKI
jgi:lipopolysaccharide biosynthesis protein